MKRTNTLTPGKAGRLWRILLTVAGSVTLVAGADWPQFMGPNGDGTSAEKGLLRAWPADGPKVLWTFAMGPGYGGAAIRDGKVYVLDRVDKKKDVLRCLDLGSGKEEWNFSYDAPGEVNHEGSRSTPAVTENYVYTVGPFGHFHCLDRATHQVVWKKNLVTDYGTKPPRWAVGQSPLLYENLVVVAPQADQVGVVAFDQATGAEKWRSGEIGAMGYCSPMKITIDQVDQIVVFTPIGVAAVRASDGKLLWKYTHACKIPIPNVTALGGGRLFVTGAYLAGSAIIQVSQDGGKWTVKELANINQMGGHCHPALLWQDHLYLLCNINERSDGMVCFDLAGKVVWQTRKDPNLDKGGSILTADGLIYVMDGRTGELYIVEPSPQGFKSLGKATLLGGKEIWGPLALSEGKLVIRDQSQMKCVDLHAP
ncbi:MAG: PQQ-like beta-propeller repeat protein [Verrucomicrobia bacterium]|nr:PQQ-like beta-propeller repeat protein [Verrucomicrobiota bacterium]